MRETADHSADGFQSLDTNLLHDKNGIKVGDTNEDNDRRDADVTSGVKGEEDSVKQQLSISGKFRRFKEDSLFRQRVVHTGIMVWSFVGMGWVIGMNGPTFPDLRQVINEDLATSSWMFTVGSFGYLSGSLLGGILYDRLNKVLLLTISSLGLGLTTLITPYCSRLPWMLFIKYTGGLFCGGLDVGANSDIINVWGSESDSYMQALHFGFSFGGLLSPLATEPFLAKIIHSCTNNTQSDQWSELLRPNTTVPSGSDNTTATLLTRYNETAAECLDQYENTKVHFAFLISALITLTSTMGYVYLFLRVRHNKQNKKPSHIDKDSKNSKNFKNRKHMTLSVKVVILVLLALLMASYCIVEDSFASFLMTFSLSHLKWTKSTGAFATTVFWSSFGIGRFSGIFIVSCCKNTTLLTVYILMLATGYVGFLISSYFLFYPLIWVFIASLGFSMSVIFPAIFSWTSEHVIHVTGKISALFLVSSSLTGITVPLLIGNLMENVSPMWFVYILVIIMSLCVSIYFALRMLVKFCLMKTTESKVNNDTTEGTEMQLIS